MNKNIYLDDYSMEDILDLLKFVKTNESDNDNYNDSEDIDNKEEKKDNKPSFTMKPNFNSKGEKIVVFSINIPLNNKLKNGLKIDILINDEMYKNIGKHFKS
jgi:hypothetical protein